MSASLLSTAAGRQGWTDLIARPAEALVAVDFDGTLARMVADPEQAHADEGAIAALGRVGSVVGTVAVITGRPVATVLRLGRFAGTPGLEQLVVLGQYGVEQWDAESEHLLVPPDPPEVAAAAADLPGLLAGLGLEDARVEAKGRAVAVHTRELPEPSDALATLSGPIGELANRYGLVVEPGRHVLEIRAAGMDKGQALEALVVARSARTAVFVGDDLGDLPAFDAVDRLRARGGSGLLVCSASDEETALAERADIVVDGPPGVARWLTALAEDLRSRHTYS